MNLIKMWYVYIVECSDKTLYCGSTNNLEKRIHQHNNTKLGSKYCKSRRPVVLKKYFIFNDKSEAFKEEYRIKQLSREDKLNLIKTI